MTLSEIRQMPTSYKFGDRADGSGIHESILRSWNIVEKLRELIEKQTPHAVLLEIIEDLKQSNGHAKGV